MTSHQAATEPFDVAALFTNWKPEPSPPVTEDRSTWGPLTDATELAALLKENIAGKTVLIDGVAPNSIAAEAARAIASASPGLLILSARSVERLSPVRTSLVEKYPSVSIKALAMDLSSLASVRGGADEVLSWTTEKGDKVKIDVLINSAGVMASPYGLTADGFETQFGVCHLAHFVFTNRLIAGGGLADGGRIVNVASSGHRFGDVRFEDYGFEDGKTYSPWLAYGQAKTANILYSLALAQKQSLKDKNITAFSVHPGGVMTDLSRHASPEVFAEMGARMNQWNPPPSPETFGTIKLVQQGASTYIATAFDPSIKGSNGSFTQDCHVAEPAPYARSVEGAEKLWKLSEKLVGEQFDF